MGGITISETKLKDIKIIEPAVFGDRRGFFTESYSEGEFQKVGIFKSLSKIITHFQKGSFA
ncbi:dTDP-4-keto-6-deoxy-D-glucose epimerase [Enterococcus casseliflavus]|nr:dTDP-4-keto-6-deoxy-D-glucose epimerase [Enterococcus casseliflavus]